VARAAVSDDTVYVGYGVFDPGGVRAFSSCGNGSLDAGEQCDDGNGSDGDCCTAECQVPATCDDADACTGNDQCTNGTCAGAITTVEQVGCTLDGLAAASCGADAIPSSVARAVTRTLGRVEKLVTRAVQAAQQGKAPKVAKARRGMLKGLDTLSARIAKAARSRKPSRQVSEACRATLDGLVASRRAVLETFVF
jgi:cysteine-rich repeat protein